jgi:spermidine synthase
MDSITALDAVQPSQGNGLRAATGGNRGMKLKTVGKLKYALDVIAFVAGAAIMAIEIVASRIVAPFLGNSVLVWTSLIGVILAALSCGYWQGGKLADRKPSPGVLAMILAVAAILTALIALTKNAWLTVAVGLPDLRLAAIAAELVLFAPVSFVLAMVSPYVLRLNLTEVGDSGTTAGRLYAVSTLGSIFGTFAAGFFLLALIGSTATLLLISALLFVVSFLSSLTAFLKTRAVIVAVAALSAWAAPATSVPFVEGRHLYETDTEYNHCLVTEVIEPATGRPIHSLMTDRAAVQSSAYGDRNDELLVAYLKYFRLGGHFQSNTQRALLLGGGAFTFVEDFFREDKEGQLDVVELDPRLPEIARRYFGLVSHPRLNIIAADARPYLNRCTKTYDAIYLDAFGTRAMVPYYLTTQETVRRIYDLLSPDGVALMNLTSTLQGPRSRFFHAELATYRSVFPRVEVFPVESTAADVSQNVILVGFKSSSEPRWTSDDARIREYLSHRYTQEVAYDTPILTDDFAPVEIYLLRAYQARMRW